MNSMVTTVIYHFQQAAWAKRFWYFSGSANWSPQYIPFSHFSSVSRSYIKCSFKVARKAEGISREVFSMQSISDLLWIFLSYYPILAYCNIYRLQQVGNVQNRRSMSPPFHGGYMDIGLVPSGRYKGFQIDSYESNQEKSDEVWDRPQLQLRALWHYELLSWNTKESSVERVFLLFNFSTR